MYHYSLDHRQCNCDDSPDLALPVLALIVASDGQLVIWATSHPSRVVGAFINLSLPQRGKTTAAGGSMRCVSSTRIKLAPLSHGQKKSKRSKLCWAGGSHGPRRSEVAPEAISVAASLISFDTYAASPPFLCCLYAHTASYTMGTALMRAILPLAVLATVAQAQPQNTAFAVRPVPAISEQEISLPLCHRFVAYNQADRVFHHSPTAS